MEKAVDQVVGVRQKNRGMSWTKQGSRALALLTVAKLNARQTAFTAARNRHDKRDTKKLFLGFSGKIMKWPCRHSSQRAR